MTKFDLNGKIVLVTGGSGGIGSAICSAFLDNGAEVIAPTSSEMNLESELSITDYLDSNSVNPDIVVHAAGLNEIAGICEVESEIVARVFRVNVFSLMTILKKVVPNMKKNQYGRVVGISSLYGIVSKAKRVPYSSSKHALTGLVKSSALELAEHNILLNCVAPGYVMTDMTRKNLTDKELEDIIKKIPTGRLQEPEEIADLCLFLCSESNQSITGQVIPVDGGFLCE